MEKIEWSDKFSVGISFLDEQHKQLVEMINLLNEHSHDELKNESISQTIKGLIDYSINHFDEEEKLFMKYDYPDYKNHKKLHEEFKTKVVSFHSANIEVNGTAIMEYLSSWLISHILKKDMQYKQYYSEKGLLDKIIVPQGTSQSVTTQ